jgi:GNAT superfamily N-acetyltransferase
MVIRDATPADAVKACDVLRASITELCTADHMQDPDILARWLASKTPENVAAWADSIGRSLLIAVGDDAVLAVGGVKDDGEITLNYVAPAARFGGVSAALLKALEARALAPAQRGPRCSAPRRRIASIYRAARRIPGCRSANSERQHPIRWRRYSVRRRVEVSHTAFRSRSIQTGT